MANVTYRLAVRWRWWFHICLWCWRVLARFDIWPSDEGMEWYIRRALVMKTTGVTNGRCTD